MPLKSVWLGGISKCRRFVRHEPGRRAVGGVHRLLSARPCDNLKLHPFGYLDLFKESYLSEWPPEQIFGLGTSGVVA